MADPAARARFVWHELMTTDTKAAGEFFTKIVGWKTRVWPQQPDYTLFMTGEQMMAGLMALPADAAAMHVPPNWLSYVGVSNVDDAARQAERLGGKVVKAAADIPTVGRFAVLQDPQGAVIAVFTPLQGSPQPAGGAPAPGDFSWHELATTDWRAALDFYHAMFGWEATDSMDMGELGTYQMYGWKGNTLGGIFNKPRQMPGPPSWLPYIKVKDAKAAAAAVKKLGAKVINGPMQVPGGDWIAQGIDLQGAVFAVHSSKPAAAAPTAAAKKGSPKKKAAPKKKVATKKTAASKKKAAPKKKAAAKKKAAPRKKSAAKKKRGR